VNAAPCHQRARQIRPKPHRSLHAMESPDDAETSDLVSLIRRVVTASKQPSKTRTLDVKPVVARLVSVAYDGGLPPVALTELVDLVTSRTYLDQASLNAIVRSLYPASEVSRALILRVVGSFGHGELKPSYGIQSALLRWLVMVYHVLETPAVLSQAYPVLFNLLDTGALRYIPKIFPRLNETKR
jgi:centromere protein I